jgi:hypothetical protein
MKAFGPSAGYTLSVRIILLATLGCASGCLWLGQEDLADRLDLDRDGYSPDIDCDDADASIYPGADELPPPTAVRSPAASRISLGTATTMTRPPTQAPMRSAATGATTIAAKGTLGTVRCPGSTCSILGR